MDLRMRIPSERVLSMNDTLEIRIRNAATAGWWTLLIAAGFLAVQSIAYLFLMSAKPAWLLAFWAHAIDWDTFGRICFWHLAIYKLCIWLLALPVLWLTLWARLLRKQKTGA